MSTLQIPCPACGRQLQLPSGSVGRLAQCPACNATFRAEEPPESQPSTSETPPETEATEAAASEPTETSQPADPAEPTASVESSPENESNPFASPLDSGMAAPIPVNPYQPTYQSEPAAILNDIEIVPRSIEDVFSPTLTIFGARLGHLVLAFILAVIAGIVGFGGWMVAVIAIEEAIGDMPSALFFLLTCPLVAFFGSYLTVGLSRNAMAVARNQPSPIQEMFPPLPIVLRFMIGGVIMSLVVGAVIGVLVAFFGIVLRIGGNPGIAASVLVIGIFGGSALSLVGYWLLWAWVFIVSDGKATALGAIQTAWTLTMHNKLTSVLLVVIAVVLSTAGTSACYIGLIITQPLTNLMFAVGYLLMTNQVISTGREQQPMVDRDEFWADT